MINKQVTDRGALIPPLPTGTVSNDQWCAFLDDLLARVLPELEGTTDDRPVLASLTLNALRSVPDHIVTETRVKALIAVSRSRYINGEAMAGVEPAVEALFFARKLNDPLTLARALNTIAIALGDTIDLAGSIEFFSESLEVVMRINEPTAQVATWTNLGGSLITGGQYQDALRCFERALQLVNAHPQLEYQRGHVLGNVALASLHSGDTAHGLRAARKSVEAIDDPKTPRELLNRTIAETNYAKLLLDVAHHDLAIERCALAKKYAELLNSPRATLVVSVAEGLVEVACGKADIGLSRLVRALEQARSMRASYRDTLYTLITAHKYLGDKNKGEVYVRELMMHTRATQRDYLQGHQRALLEEQVRPELPATATEDGIVRLADEETPEWKRLERLAQSAALRGDASQDGGQHPFRVGRLSALIAEAHGMTLAQCRAVELAARVHDIGMGAMPDSALGERADSASLERIRLRRHPELGAELLDHVDLELARFAKDVVLHHHECYDGSGYPEGFMGSSIPLAARIVGVANAFDVLTHSGPSRSAKSIDQALDELAAQKRKKFDPHIVDLCVSVISRLRIEVPDLDDYLSQPAESSPLAAARKRIHNLLASPVTASTAEAPQT